jgi:hypothetical protein
MHENGQQSPWSKSNSAMFKARSHAPSPTAQSRARLAAACFTARDAAGTGLAVGSAVGALVEMAMHLDCSHSVLPMQSSLSVHFRPSSHGRHDPPQSTSVSSPLSWPSMQDIEVGDNVVGMKDGRSVVGGGGGPVLPTTLEANTGLNVGAAVGVFDGYALGENVSGSVGAELGLSVGDSVELSAGESVGAVHAKALNIPLTPHVAEPPPL